VAKLSQLLRHPVVLLVLLVVIAAFAARFGWMGHVTGLWDGPI